MNYQNSALFKNLPNISSFSEYTHYSATSLSTTHFKIFFANRTKSKSVRRLVLRRYLAKIQESGILTSICFMLFLPSIPLEVSGKEMNRKGHAPTHFYLSFCYQLQSALWTRLVHMEDSPRLRHGITWLSFAVFPLLGLC